MLEEEEREDNDGHEIARDAAPEIRKWLVEESRKHARQGDILSANLLDLERLASDQLYGLDYDTDYSDIDDIGPF